MEGAGTYQNRSARNRVQIVSMVPQKNGLFALSSQHCRDGVPYVYARDLAVDAADQVVDEEQKTFPKMVHLAQPKMVSCLRTHFLRWSHPRFRGAPLLAA